MPFQIGAISAKIALDASGYKRGIGDAENSNRSFGSSFQSFVTNPLTIGVGVVAAAGGGFAVYASRVLESAEATQRLAQRTGLSTDLVQALRAQLELASGAGAKSTEIFNAFSIRLGQAAQGAGEAGPAFAALGLRLGEFGSTEEALRAAIDALQRVPDAAQRAALAAKLFGEQGGPLLVNALKDTGSIDDLIARMRDFGQVLDRDTIDSVASLNTTLGFAKLGFEGLLNTAFAEFLKVFASGTGKADENLRVFFRGIKDEAIPIVKDFADNIEALTGNIDQLAEKLAQLGRSASVLNPYSERGQTIRTQALTSPGDIVGSRSFGEIGARAVFRQVPGLSDEAVKDLARRAVAR